MKKALILVLKTYAILLAVALIVIGMTFVFTGCNKQIIDLDYKFNYAIIFLPDGNQIEGTVTSWNDYDQSDMIQVKIDGVTYLTHSSNVILEAR